MFLTGRAGSSFWQREALCAAGRVGQELPSKAWEKLLLTFGFKSTSPTGANPGVEGNRLQHNTEAKRTQNRHLRLSLPPIIGHRTQMLKNHRRPQQRRRLRMIIRR